MEFLVDGGNNHIFYGTEVGMATLVSPKTIKINAINNFEFLRFY